MIFLNDSLEEFLNQLLMKFQKVIGHRDLPKIIIKEFSGEIHQGIYQE